MVAATLTSLLTDFTAMSQSVIYFRNFAFRQELGCCIVGAIHLRNTITLGLICAESSAGTVKQRSETSCRRRLLEGSFRVGDEVSKQRPRYKIELAFASERKIKGSGSGSF